MELRHVRYFVAVAEEMHFGRAAQRLRISQPPLSVQIRDLEHELGAELFDRSRQKIALTQAGRLFLDQARGLLENVGRMKQDLRAAVNGEAGELKIGFTQSAEFAAFLPETLRQFRMSFPGVALKLLELATEDQLHAILDRSLDVGISRKPKGRLSNLVKAEKLCTDALVVAVPADDPLASKPIIGLDEISERPVICMPRNDGTGLHDAVMVLFRAAGITPLINQTVSQLLTIVWLVAAGFGVAVLPASLESVRRPGVVFRPIRDKGAWSTLFVLTSTGDDSRLTRAFRDILFSMVEGGRELQPGAVA